MIDPKLIRNNIEAVNLALAKRGVQLNVEEWASLEAHRKELQSKTEALQAERNSGAKQVGQIKKSGGDASEVMVMTLKLLKLRLLNYKPRLKIKR